MEDWVDTYWELPLEERLALGMQRYQEEQEKNRHNYKVQRWKDFFAGGKTPPKHKYFGTSKWRTFCKHVKELKEEGII